MPDKKCCVYCCTGLGPHEPVIPADQPGMRRKASAPTVPPIDDATVERIAELLFSKYSRAMESRWEKIPLRVHRAWVEDARELIAAIEEGRR